MAITLFVKLGDLKKTLSSDDEKNAFFCSDPARLVSTMVGEEKSQGSSCQATPAMSRGPFLDC